MRLKELLPCLRKKEETPEKALILIDDWGMSGNGRRYGFRSRAQASGTPESCLQPFLLQNLTFKFTLAPCLQLASSHSF